MTPSAKLTTLLCLLLLGASNTHASYFGGIGVAPFEDSSDNLFCPSGTTFGEGSPWCCPSGTELNTAQDSNVLCCPSAADCTDDLLNSGVQCADPSMTLFKNGGSLLCCPSGYFVNVYRNCVNSGTPDLYTSTAQGASLTPDGSSPSAAPSASGSAVASNSAVATGATGASSGGSPTPTATAAVSGTGTTGTAKTESGTVGTGTAAGGVGGTSTTSTAVSSSTSAAAGVPLDKGPGALCAFLAICGMLLV